MKQKRKLLLLPLLFALSGCTFIYEDYFIGIKGLNLGLTIPTIKTATMQIGLSIVQVINGAYATIYKIMTDGVTSAFTNSIAMSKAINMLPTLLNTVFILMGVSLALRLGYAIFKDNMSDTNKAMAPDFATRIKRLVVALGVGVCFPYLCTTAFLASGYIADLATKPILRTIEGGNAYEIYDVMSDYGISYGTYCEVGQEATKQGSDVSKLASTGKNIEVITRDTAGNFPLPVEFIEDNPTFTNANNDLYGFWCGGGDGRTSGTALNVWTSLFVDNDYFKNTLLYGEGVTLVEVILTAIMAIFVTVIAFFALIAMAKQVADLLILIVTSWWYISSSIENEVSITLLGRKLATICFTQFMLIIEFAIYYALLNLNLPTLLGLPAKVMLVVAMSMILISTPLAIADMVQDTGTAKQALKGGIDMFK